MASMFSSQFAVCTQPARCMALPTNMGTPLLCNCFILQVLQELPLLNAGSDVPLNAAATLSGKGFSGPREVTVQATIDGW